MGLVSQLETTLRTLSNGPLLMILSSPSRWARSRNCEKATVSFGMSVRMEQLGFHWTDFHEI